MFQEMMPMSQGGGGVEPTGTVTTYSTNYSSTNYSYNSRLNGVSTSVLDEATKFSKIYFQYYGSQGDSGINAPSKFTVEVMYEGSSSYTSLGTVDAINSNHLQSVDVSPANKVTSFKMTVTETHATTAYNVTFYPMGIFVM